MENNVGTADKVIRVIVAFLIIIAYLRRDASGRRGIAADRQRIAPFQCGKRILSPL